jgi:hypothetical protein
MEIPDWDKLYTIETKTLKGWEVTHIYDPSLTPLSKVLEVFQMLAINRNEQFRLTVPEPKA